MRFFGMISQESRYCLTFYESFVVVVVSPGAPHCQEQLYDSSSEHHLSLAIEGDARTTLT